MGRRAAARLAQDAEPGAGAHSELVFAVVHEVVFAIAEKDEVSFREPAEKLRRLVALGRADRSGRLGELIGDGERTRLDGRPVLDRGPHVGDDAEQIAAELVQQGGLGLTVDLDVQIGLLDSVAARVRRHHLLELAARVPAHPDDRMDGEMQAVAVTGQLHRHRVDEERHVLDHELHDRMGRSEAVLVDVRREDPQQHLSGPAVAPEAEMRHGHPVEIGHPPALEVFRIGPAVVPLDERREKGGLLGAQTLSPVSGDSLDDLGSDLGPHCPHGRPPLTGTAHSLPRPGPARNSGRCRGGAPSGTSVASGGQEGGDRWATRSKRCSAS